jgi:hypothetical protein
LALHAVQSVIASHVVGAGHVDASNDPMALRLVGHTSVTHVPLVAPPHHVHVSAALHCAHVKLCVSRRASVSRKTPTNYTSQIDVDSCKNAVQPVEVIVLFGHALAPITHTPAAQRKDEDLRARATNKARALTVRVVRRRRVVVRVHVVGLAAEAACAVRRALPAVEVLYNVKHNNEKNGCKFARSVTYRTC